MGVLGTQPGVERYRCFRGGGEGKPACILVALRFGICRCIAIFAAKPSWHQWTL